MAITILSASFTGMNSYIVSVEVDIFNGLPGFSIVGMGDTAIIESRERIRSSLKNIDVIFPAKKVIVNLSPADIRKKGSQFDLSICTGILANLGYIENMPRLEKYLIISKNLFFITFWDFFAWCSVNNQVKEHKNKHSTLKWSAIEFIWIII